MEKEKLNNKRLASLSGLNPYSHRIISEEAINKFFNNTQKDKTKKEVRTLSNSSSGATKPSGIKSQDDTNLQMERSDSLSVDTQSPSDNLKWEHRAIQEGRKQIFEHYFKGIKNPVILSQEEFDKLVNIAKQINIK